MTNLPGKRKSEKRILHVVLEAIYIAEAIITKRLVTSKLITSDNHKTGTGNDRTQENQSGNKTFCFDIMLVKISF